MIPDTPIFGSGSVTLGAGADVEQIIPARGVSTKTGRGANVLIAISGHTSALRVRGYLSEAATGPWFLAFTINAVVGTPVNDRRRLPAAPFVRIQIVNVGGAPTTFGAWIAQLAERVVG